MLCHNLLSNPRRFHEPVPYKMKRGGSCLIFEAEDEERAEVEEEDEGKGSSSAKLKDLGPRRTVPVTSISVL